MSENVTTSEVINSKLYGEFEVESSQIYDFKDGIVGFTQLNKFALLPLEDSEVFILHSFTEELSLMLFPAIHSQNHISFQIDEAVVNQLGVTSQEELAVFYVLRFMDDKPYINLRAPILIVPNTQKGCQYIIPNDGLSVREPLVLKGDV